MNDYDSLMQSLLQFWKAKNAILFWINWWFSFRIRLSYRKFVCSIGFFLVLPSFNQTQVKVQSTPFYILLNIWSLAYFTQMLAASSRMFSHAGISFELQMLVILALSWGWRSNSRPPRHSVSHLPNLNH